MCHVLKPGELQWDLFMSRFPLSKSPLWGTILGPQEHPVPSGIPHEVIKKFQGQVVAGISQKFDALYRLPLLVSRPKEETHIAPSTQPAAAMHVSARSTYD